MAEQLEFPKITIDYDQNLGDIITIIRSGKTWRAIFSYTNGNVAAIVTNEAGEQVSIDVTDIKDESTLVQQTVARILIQVIYTDYSYEMQQIVISPKKANMIQKSFDVSITQPTKDSEGNFIDPWWKANISQDGVYLMTIKRHNTSPDVFHLFFPNINSCIAIYQEDSVMKFAKPALICNNPNDLIDLTITPEVIEEGITEQ